MTELEGARDEAHLHGGLLGLLNLGEQQDDECNDKDAQGYEHSWGGIGNHGVLGNLTNQSTHQDVNSYCGSRVEGTANLDELVAGLAATAQHVEQRINNSVEHAHAHAADEGAQQINPVSTATTDLAAQVLDHQTDDTHDERSQCSLFVTHFCDEHSARNTHQQISDKVGVVADLSSGFRRAELILDDGCHG